MQFLCCETRTTVVNSGTYASLIETLKQDQMIEKDPGFPW